MIATWVAAGVGVALLPALAYVLRKAHELERLTKLTALHLRVDRLEQWRVGVESRLDELDR